jgi:hypothetical protein
LSLTRVAYVREKSEGKELIFNSPSQKWKVNFFWSSGFAL